MKPSYDDETLAAYFQPLGPEIWADPVVGPVLRQIEREDPDLVAAVVDVDRSQIRDNLGLPPWERLLNACAWVSSLTRFRRVAE
jgi:hypothetical protein